MSSRKISLTKRAENTREARQMPIPTRFSLNEIEKHFVDSMEEVNLQFSVAEELIKNDKKTACKTVWRSQVVLAEGLLDFYIHEISKFCFIRMFSGVWLKTEKYRSFPIPMDRVESAISACKSIDWLLEYLNNRFSREVFLSCESMRDQLNLIGIEFKKVMIKAFPRENEQKSISDGKRIIAELFQRRNEIAHQNDRCHASAEQKDITEDFVRDYISKVESIVKAIHCIANEIEITQPKDENHSD